MTAQQNNIEKHCIKEPNCAKLDENAVSKGNKSGNVIQLTNNYFAQCSQPQKKLTPRKPKSEERRSRKYLTTDEVTRLRKAAKEVGRLGERDSLIILLMYRHGLRVSEVCSLRWEAVQLNDSVIHINRRKNGSASVQVLEGDEIRALRKLKREQLSSSFVFTSERKGPLSTRSVQTLIERAGRLAGIEFPVNAHSLRHACGYALANKGTDTRSIQAYLGHKNIQHTVTYTNLSSARFKSFGAILGG